MVRGKGSISSLLKHFYEREEIYHNIAEATTPDEDNRYFRKLKLHIELGVCVECGEDVRKTGFRTQDEREEFSISALCSNCQIKYFGR